MKCTDIIARYVSTLTLPVISNNIINNYVVNRNPRNLERLCIATKPAGYSLERPGIKYWHKLEISVSSRNVTARIIHNRGFVFVKASTCEWAIKKNLYKTTDLTSYLLVGKVLAQRCLECGLTEAYWNFTNGSKSHKLTALIEETMKHGLILTESCVYVHPKPSDSERPKKSWEIG